MIIRINSQRAVQENTNMRLNEMPKVIQDFKSKFNKEIEVLNKIQIGMKMEVKNSNPI